MPSKATSAGFVPARRPAGAWMTACSEVVARAAAAATPWAVHWRGSESTETGGECSWTQPNPAAS